MGRGKTILLSKEELFVDALTKQQRPRGKSTEIDGQHLLLLAWEYSRLWPEVFERHRLKPRTANLRAGINIPTSGVLPKYAMTFILSKHWPKKTYLDLSLPQRIEAFPYAPCFQQKIHRHPVVRQALGDRKASVPSPMRVLQPLSDNPLEQNFIYQAIRAPRDNSRLILLDMTAGRYELEKELKLFFDEEFPSSFDGWKRALSALAIYKAFLANWSPEWAIRKIGNTTKDNPYAMYYLWCKAIKRSPTMNIDESIVPVQESRHRISYAKKVPRYFKELFGTSENPIRISEGPFLARFK